MTSESLIASLGTGEDCTLSLILLTRLLPTLPRDSLHSLKDAILHQLAQPTTTNKNVLAHLVAETALLSPAWPELHQFLTSSSTSPLILQIYTEAPQLLPNQDPTPFLNQGTQSFKFLVAFLKFVPFPSLQQYSHLFPSLFNSLPNYLLTDHESLNNTLTLLIDLFDQTQRTTFILKSHHSTLTTFLLTLLSPPSPNGSTPYLEEETYQLVLELLCSIVEYAESLSFDDPEFLPSLIGVLLNLMARTDGFAGVDGSQAENDEKEWLARSDFSTNDEEEETIGFVAEGVLDRISIAIGGRIFKPIIDKLSTVLLSPLPPPTTSTASSISRVHYSALSALATIAEGCATEIIENLSGVISLILPSIKSPYPRLRFAAIYALGQLCTDTEGAIQEEHGIEVLSALLSVVSGGAGEYRKLKAYATSCLVNYFQYPSSLPPLLPGSSTSIYPQLFYTLLALLRDESHLDTDSDDSPETVREKNDWVKGHALEAIGSFAGCPGEDFSPYYQELMPTVLGLLENDALETRVREAGGLSAGIRDRLIDCSASIAIVIPSALLATDSYRLLSALWSINQHNLSLDQSSRPPSTDEEIDVMADRVIEKESTFQYLLSAFLRLAEKIPFAASTSVGSAGGGINGGAGESGRERFIIPFLQSQALPLLLSTAMASILSSAEQVGQSTAEAIEEEDEEDIAATREESLVAVENLVILVQALEVPAESIGSDGPSRLRIEELGRIREVALSTIADVDHLAIREAAAALLAVTSKSLQNEIPADSNRQLFSETTSQISTHLSSDEIGEITSSLLASWVTILISLPHLEASDLRTGKEYYLTNEAMEGFIGSLGIVLERVRGREMSALASEPAAGAGEEEEEELAWDDERYYDESILNSVYRAIHLLNGYYSTAGKMDRISKFNAFLGLLNFPSGGSIGVFRFSRRFALRLLASIITSNKESSFQIVSQYLPSINQGLLDKDIEIREYASRVIMAIVDLSPSERNAYGAFVRSSVEGLFGSIGEIDLDDERLLMARDISIATLAKIIQTSSSDPSSGINVDNLLPVWLAKLPIMISTDSFPIVVSLLLQLIESSHPSLLSPTLPSHHILKVLISHLDNPNLPSGLLPSLTGATKRWLQAMDPYVGKELFESMPEAVQELLLE